MSFSRRRTRHRFSTWNENRNNTGGECWYFKHGGCYYGEYCWFTHTDKRTLEEKERDRVQKEERERQELERQQQIMKRRKRRQDKERRAIFQRKMEKIQEVQENINACYIDIKKQLKFDVHAMSSCKAWKFRRFNGAETDEYQGAVNVHLMKLSRLQMCLSDEDNEYESDQKDDSESETNPDDYFSTSFGGFKKDGPEPEIVSATRNDDLEQIKAYIASGGDLNKRQLWAEVVHKNWKCFGDSALLVAAANGSTEIVKVLLLHQADPMLVSCPYDDSYNTALQAAGAWQMNPVNTQIIEMITIVNALWTELNPNCDESLHDTSTSTQKNKPDKKVIEQSLSDFL